MSSKNGDRDRELARLFEAGRRSDEAHAPAFRELLARRGPLGTKPARRIVWTALAAAAVTAVLVGTLLLRPSPPRAAGPDPTATAARLAAWKAPTDVLLKTPGGELLTQVPVLVSSSTQAIPSNSESTKGVEK